MLHKPEHIIGDVQESPQRQSDHDNPRPEGKQGDRDWMGQLGDRQSHSVEPDRQQERDEPKDDY